MIFRFSMLSGSCFSPFPFPLKASLTIADLRFWIWMILASIVSSIWVVTRSGVYFLMKSPSYDEMFDMDGPLLRNSVQPVNG